MAIVNNVTGEAIEILRGYIDFYMLRGILPVARKYPQKITPPYTALQAEAQAVFGLAASYTSIIGGEILNLWRLSAEGKRQQWTDTFKYLIMSYWKKKRVIPLIVLDYDVLVENENVKISWQVLQTDLARNEEIFTINTDLFPVTFYEEAREQIFFTLTDDEKIRQVCPYIPLVL
jgi:hypothetical protein